MRTHSLPADSPVVRSACPKRRSAELSRVSDADLMRQQLPPRRSLEGLHSSAFSQAFPEAAGQQAGPLEASPASPAAARILNQAASSPSCFASSSGMANGSSGAVSGTASRRSSLANSNSGGMSAATSSNLRPKQQRPAAPLRILVAEDNKVGDVVLKKHVHSEHGPPAQGWRRRVPNLKKAAGANSGSCCMPVAEDMVGRAWGSLGLEKQLVHILAPARYPTSSPAGPFMPLQTSSTYTKVV